MNRAAAVTAREEGLKMAKTIPSKRPVYIAAAIVIVVTALWAVLLAPRLDMYPEGRRLSRRS